MAIRRIHHLGAVIDVEASADWYASVLGFYRAGSHATADGTRRKVFLQHDQLGVRLGLCQHATSAGRRFDETQPGLDHLCFAVDDLGELREWEERLGAQQVPFTPAAPASTLTGAHVIVLRDPDNIQLELVAE